MTPQQFDILKKSTYGVLALSLGISVLWLSSGGNMFQASLVQEQTPDQLAQTYNEVQADDTLRSAADQTFGGDQFGTGGALGLSVTSNEDTSTTSQNTERATISNEVATYRQTMTTGNVEEVRTTMTEQGQTNTTPAPNQMPTTGPSEILFFLLSMGGALGCFAWYKKSEQK